MLKLRSWYYERYEKERKIIINSNVKWHHLHVSSVYHCLTFNGLHSPRSDTFSLILLLITDCCFNSFPMYCSSQLIYSKHRKKWNASNSSVNIQRKRERGSYRLREWPGSHCCGAVPNKDRPENAMHINNNGIDFKRLNHLLSDKSVCVCTS